VTLRPSRPIRRASEGAPKGGVGRDPNGGRLLAGPVGLPDLLEGQLAGRAVEPVDEQHTVEVICLVLDTAGQQVAALHDHWVAELVEPLGHHPQCTLGVIGQAGQREAALLAVLLLVRQIKIRIHEMAGLIIDAVGEDPQADADLGGCETQAWRVHHRVGQILDEDAQLLVEVDHRICGGTEHGVSKEPDGLDGHA